MSTIRKLLRGQLQATKATERFAMVCLIITIVCVIWLIASAVMRTE